MNVHERVRIYDALRLELGEPALEAMRAESSGSRRLPTVNYAPREGRWAAIVRRCPELYLSIETPSGPVVRVATRRGFPAAVRGSTLALGRVIGPWWDERRPRATSDTPPAERRDWPASSSVRLLP